MLIETEKEIEIEITDLEEVQKGAAGSTTGIENEKLCNNNI